jgi:DNA-binding transcriptional ArsR family regulator
MSKARVDPTSGASSDAVFDGVFKALASGTRRSILDLLKDGPRTTGDLCAHFPALDRCTVMQHLGVLHDTGLVVARRQGRERWNHLDVLPIKLVHDRWISGYAASAVDLLAALKADLESAGPVSR